MPIELTWPQVLLRLALSLAASAVVGLNRSEHGRAAGLRTTVLVCLAATGAMVQANLLLAMAHEKQSLVALDLMRLRWRSEGNPHPHALGRRALRRTRAAS
jgi:putative Mg2+ transporter-C (MgtC) family protein